VESQQHEPGGKIAMMALILAFAPSHPALPEPSTAIDKAFERAEEIFANIQSSRAERHP
jgi:hypothetical protein